MKNLQNMSGEQLLLARILNIASHKAVQGELARRRKLNGNRKTAKAA